MKSKVIYFLIFFTSFFSQAAIQGNLDRGDCNLSSTGSLDIDIQVVHSIQVNQLDNINLGQFNSGIDSNKSGSDSFCVFSNTSKFSLIMSSENNNNGVFRMKGGNQYIPYSLEMNTLNLNGSVATTKSIVSGIKNSNISQIRNTVDCMENGVFKPNVKINVNILEDSMLDVLPNNYSDIITIIASPE